MKVLLCYHFQGNFAMAGMEPLGLIQLGRLLRDRGHEVRYAKMDLGLVRKAIKAFQPRLIGYSICSVHHNHSIALNRRLKQEYDFYSVFGGPHPTYFPEMIQAEGVDAVCVGEADLSFPDFVDRLEAGENFQMTPNMWVKLEPGVVQQNPLAPMVSDLDSLPYPDREGLYSNRWLRDYPLKSFINSRGCPYNCTYCYNRLHRELYGKGQPVWRYRSPEHLVGEMEWVKKNWPLAQFILADDVFVPSTAWLARFVEEYRRRVNLPFTCLLRLDRVDDEQARLLAEAGCSLVLAAIESGDERIRREVLGRKMTDEQIIFGAEALHRQGIKLCIENMMGMPGESLEDALKTLSLNVRCNADMATTALFTPFPNLELTRRAIAEGFFTGDVSELPRNMTSRSVLNLPDKAEIERLQKLFPLLLDLPWMRRRVRRLVKLPLHPFYSMLRNAWLSVKGYRMLKFRPSLRAHAEIAWRGLRYIFQDR